MSSPLLTAVAAALAAALIIASAFGVRDALRTVRHNTYVDLSQYFWSYVAVPVVAMTGLAIPLASTVGVAGFATGSTASRIGGFSAGLLVALVLTLEAAAWLAGVLTKMHEARVSQSGRKAATIFTATMLLVAISVATVAVAYGAAQLATETLRMLAGAALVLNVALIPPLVTFLMRDFRLSPVLTAFRPRGSADKGVVSAGGPRPPARSDVVLISIDTLRADHLGAYGSQRGLTPHLDRLAAAGVVCEAAIAPSSWTLPSVASFLTGLYPARHGAGAPVNGFDLMARTALRPGTWTLAAGLKAAGYQTHAVVSNPYLALAYGLDAGFDTYENVSIESEALVALRPTIAGRLLSPLLRDRVSDTGAVVTQRALRLLAGLSATPVGRRTPAFIWVHYIDPHAPYGCSGDKSFRGDTLLSGITHRGSRLDNHFDAIARLRAGEIRLSPAEKDELIALYDAGVAEVDRQVGVLANRVRELSSCGSQGMPHDPLIVVVADHGEEFWDHGGVEHGHTFYEELVRVPLIFAGAGLAAGDRLSGLTRLIDLPPTGLELLGIPVPAGIDGESLVARSNGHIRLQARDGVAVCESLLFAEEKVALRTERYKYVSWTNGKEELYDLASDPAELRDLAATADLTWARERVAEHASLRLESGAGDDPAGPHADSAAIRARLEALGYM